MEKILSSTQNEYEMTSQSILSRFWDKVEKTNSCWNWRAGKNSDGYGTFWIGKTVSAHRFAYQLLIGSIPKDKEIDHLCRNRSCVNPVHMEIVTNKINVLRGISSPAENARKTYCKNGHPFNEENTINYKDGRRQCRPCKKEYENNYHRARKMSQ